MTEKQLAATLDRFSSLTILVIGDFCLDRYVRGTMVDISEEAAIPVISASENRFSPGAAGNTSWNLRDLGCRVRGLTVVGEDYYGDILLRELAGRGIETDLVLRDPSRATPGYEKFYARSKFATIESYQQSTRVDTENHAALSRRTEEALLARIREASRTADALVVVDQAREHGVVTATVREAVARSGKELGKPAIADSRKRIGSFRDYALLVPNDYEARASSGIQMDERARLSAQEEAAQVETAGRHLLQHCRAGCVAVTRGPAGISLFCRETTTHVPTMPLRESIDITGAGDAVTAAMTASICCGATLEDAARIANIAAFITVRKIGTTGTATPGEILSAYRDFRRLYEA